MRVVFVRDCVMLYGVFWVVCVAGFVCVAIRVWFVYDVSCDVCMVCCACLCLRVWWLSVRVCVMSSGGVCVLLCLCACLRVCVIGCDVVCDGVWIV